MPDEGTLWRAFEEMVAEFATPVDARTSSSDVAAYACRELSDGHLVRFCFGPREWLGYLAAPAAAASLRGERVSEVALGWTAVRDELHYLIYTGYPWVEMRHYEIVGICELGGEAWPAEPGL